MREQAPSFGQGLQMVNLTKDFHADLKGGWNYIFLSYITDQGLTKEQFFRCQDDDRVLAVYHQFLKKCL
jgi:phytoene/squalene synthetase